MRILIYLEQESWGGVDTHLLSLLSDWPDRADEITLMTNRGNQGFVRHRDKYASLAHVTTIEIPALSHNLLISKWRRGRLLKFIYPTLHFLQPLTYVMGALRFKKQIRDLGQFDVVLANNGGYPAAWGSISFLEGARLAGIATRLLLVHHAATKPLPFMSWFEQIIDRRLGRLTNALITVSKATKQTLLMNRFIDDEAVNLRVIHNQVAAPDAAEPSIDLRATLGVTATEVIIGIVGRVEAYKGHADVIAGLAELPEAKRGHFKFAIFGAGEQAEIDRLKILAKSLGVLEQIHFMGFVDGSPASLIAQLDLCVMATRSFEGYGLTLAEAMQVGTPILATDVGAVREFVTAENGRLVPPCDPRAIAMALSDFLDNPDSFRARAKQAKKDTPQDARNMAAAYRQVMTMCLASNGVALANNAQPKEQGSV